MIYYCLMFFTTSCNTSTQKSSDLTGEIQSLRELTKDEYDVFNNCITLYFDAMENGKYEYVIEKMYTPFLTELSEQNTGYSEEELVEKLAEQIRLIYVEMKNKGIKVTINLDEVNPSVIDYDKDLYNVIKYKVTMFRKAKEHSEIRSLFAISEDSGITWSFVEDTDDSRAIIKEKLPDSLFNHLIK